MNMSEENKAPAQPQATATPPASGEMKPVELTVQDLGVLRSSQPPEKNTKHPKTL